MGRSLLFSLPLALLIALPPAATSAATSATDCGKNFQTQLDCWREQARQRAGQGKPLTVTLWQPLQLDDSARAMNLADYQDAFGQYRLAVSIPAGHTSGPGGTVLLILAGRRYVAPDSQVTTLLQQDLAVLGAVCRDELCSVIGPAAAEPTVDGQALLDRRLALPLARSAKTKQRPAPAPSPDPSPGFSWRTAFLVLLVGLLALLGVVVLLGRGLRLSTGSRSAGPAGRARPAGAAVPAGSGEPAGRPLRRRYGRQVAIPPGPRRTAIVRTDLHPQGYVEVDRCLFRAVWANHQAPAPAPGASIDVVQGVGADADILLALPQEH
jgi:hypothetical protein